MRGLPGLKVAREAVGLTQRGLSESTGLSAQFISFLECGRSDPSSETLVRLAEVLGVTVDSLLRPEQPTITAHPQAEVAQ